MLPPIMKPKRYNRKALMNSGSTNVREDMAVMLMRALDYKEIELEEGTSKSFSDEAQISEYAKESVEKLSAAGVISGMTETEFQPKGYLTRAQAAKIIFTSLKYKVVK